MDVHQSYDGVIPKLHRVFFQDPPLSYHVQGDSVVGELQIDDTLRAPESWRIRSSVLAAVGDQVTGILAAQRTDPATALTSDLALVTADDMIATARRTERFSVTSQILKAGRSLIVCECRFGNAGAEGPLAICEATFVASPRGQDLTALPSLYQSSRPRAHRLPFERQLGARIVAAGMAEVDLVPYVLQSTGALQGGVLALLAELAAESLTGRLVTDLHVRYLRALRVGPARATAQRFGRYAALVEVRDADGRVTTVVIARTEGSSINSLRP